MKRVVLTLASLLVLVTLLVPATALGVEGAVKAKVTQVATETGVLIVYPEAPPDATAEEALASTPFQKSGDLLNLIIALGSLGAIAGIIAWGIVASRTPKAAS